MLLLPRVWMRYMWSVNIRMCVLMICRECHLIKLQSVTTPVYKRPYPMALNEMVELKT
jgi:hypothetical protein